MLYFAHVQCEDKQCMDMQCLEIDGGITVPLVNRETWKGLPPSSTTPLQHPITHIRFTYEDLRKYNTDMFQMMPDCQKHYMEKEGLSDIPWNFLIGDGGIIVEGRGWHSEPWRPEDKFPHLKGKRCLDIAFMGDYKDPFSKPRFEMQRSAMYLILHGLKENYISADYTTLPMRDVPVYYEDPFVETRNEIYEYNRKLEQERNQKQSGKEE